MSSTVDPHKALRGLTAASTSANPYQMSTACRRFVASLKTDPVLAAEFEARVQLVKCRCQANQRLWECLLRLLADVRKEAASDNTHVFQQQCTLLQKQIENRDSLTLSSQLHDIIHLLRQLSSNGRIPGSATDEYENAISSLQAIVDEADAVFADGCRLLSDIVEGDSRIIPARPAEGRAGLDVAVEPNNPDPAAAFSEPTSGELSSSAKRNAQEDQAIFDKAAAQLLLRSPEASCNRLVEAANSLIEWADSENPVPIKLAERITIKECASLVHVKADTLRAKPGRPPWAQEPRGRAPGELDFHEAMTWLGEYYPQYREDLPRNRRELERKLSGPGPFE